MKKLTLKSPLQANATLLENEFIDEYMPKANGDYVKVYLLLLRCCQSSSPPLSVSQIADLLDGTEKDVVRALNYWQRLGLIDYEEAEGLALPPGSPPFPAGGSAAGTGGGEDIKELLFVAEQYLQKTLSATDINAITYFFDTLHMSAELIEYLIEYCVENGHKSIHYIQKVALSWSEDSVSTVSQAKERAALYHKSCYAVLNAYGIKGRSPAPSEVSYIRRWEEEFGFSQDLILEACARTINTIHQPSFEYTESILKRWKKDGVKYLQDIKAADLAYRKEREEKKKTAALRSPQKKRKNAFHNFEERTYDDMDELTRRLIKN